MASSPDKLTALQRAILGRFFAAAPPSWFLTGGAALAGFWLKHRRTEDLDLFTADGSVDDGVRVLVGLADALGGSARAMVRAPDFARFLVTVGADSVLVDLVRDRVPALYPKVDALGVRLDPLAEIAANKLTTLVNRAEPRDLVDLRALLAAGIDLDEALSDAVRKDLSAEPATLAWVLSTSVLPASGIPEGFSREELLAFREQLERELRRRSVPPA